MEQKMKIALSCFFGAAIGAVIALEVHLYFWWVGALAGGLVGYIGYDVRRFIAAIPEAWNYAVSGEGRRMAKQGLIAAIISSAILIPGVLLISGFVYQKQIHAFLPAGYQVGEVWSIYFGMSVASFLVLQVMLGHYIEVPKWKELEWMHALLLNHVALLLFTPVLAICIALAFVIGASVVAFNVVRTGIRFTKHLFILVHSEARLICGCDAAIGATIGFFAGSPLIGGIVGAAVGVLNYEIISKRLLKLAPR